MEEKALFESSSGRAIHLFDNGELTFSKIKDIFAAASEGHLEGTEKIGEQSVMASFSIKDGRLKCASNKADIKSSGLSIESFANKLNPEIKDAFLNSAKLFEKTIQGLSHTEQEKLFGKETNIFYNCSLIGGTDDDVINYDTKSLIINSTDHLIYDRENNSFLENNIDDKLNSLRGVIDDSQTQLKQDNFGVQVNAVKKLQALSDKKPYNLAISKISSLLSTVNGLIKNDSLALSEESSISEFMIARVYILINAILQKGKIKNFDPIVKMNIAKRILGVKGISVKDISSKISKEQLEFIKDNLLNDTSRSEILKTAILPLENIVNDFAIEMLRGLQSAFVLDNNKEVNRIKKDLKAAIDILLSSDNEEVMKVLKQQMSKLRSLERMGTAAQGFVFDYDGKTYKFSGNFAPVSAILSLFKAVSQEKQQLNEANKTAKNETIALVPGAFKPPHKGHLEMIKNYAKMSDRVIILVSPLPRQMPDGQNVTAEDSKKIWNIYLESAGLASKVLVLDSEWNSPVYTAHKFIKNEENRPEFAQPGQTIILGASTKDGDDVRFKNIVNDVRPGVNAQAIPAKSLGNMRAADLRTAIYNGDLKEIEKYMPDSLNKKKTASQILNIFGKQPQKVQENYIYDIIKEEIRKKGSKYCLILKKSKKENMASGAVAGGVAAITEPKEK
jgi:cytidyltransferase-like protein